MPVAQAILAEPAAGIGTAPTRATICIDAAASAGGGRAADGCDERDVTRLGLEVTCCRRTESCREMGLGELGAVLSRSRAGAFHGGDEARPRLTRTRSHDRGRKPRDFRHQWAENKGNAGPPAD
jgi:hypothetical protein